MENYQLQSRNRASVKSPCISWEPGTFRAPLSATSGDSGPKRLCVLVRLQAAQCPITVIDPICHLGNIPHGQQCSEHPGLCQKSVITMGPERAHSVEEEQNILTPLSSPLSC